MSNSKDRVLFNLAPRYYQTYSSSSSSMIRSTCLGILHDALGLPCDVGKDLMRMHPDGITFLCRPAQFALFIILRYERGDCINGVRDLRPRLVCYTKDPYDVLAFGACVTRDQARRVLDAAAHNGFVEPLFTERDWSYDYDASSHPNTLSACV